VLRGAPVTRVSANYEFTLECVIKPFGFEITSASFAMYTFSLSVFIQALSLVSFSAIADHGNSPSKFSYQTNN